MWTPDDLDVRIVRTLASPDSFQWDVRIPFARVGERLQVGEETVRNRVNRMKRAQFLQGWQLVLNPHLVGRQAAVVELRVADSESKAKVISRLKLIEGVIRVDDFYGQELAVTHWYESEAGLEGAVELFAAVCRCPDPLPWKLAFPACELRPTRTDWRIMQAMRRDGRARLTDVAHGLGVSARTVKRRVTHMVEAKAFYLDPLLDLGNVGGLRCRFWISAEAGRKRAVDQAILSRLARIVSLNRAAEEFSVFVAHLANPSESAENLQWMGRIPGIRAVRSNFEVGHIHAEDWLDIEIERRLPVFARPVIFGGPSNPRPMGAAA